MSIVTKCCQQSTEDRPLSITLSVQLCAQHDDDWVWHNASLGLLVSAKPCWDMQVNMQKQMDMDKLT